MPALCFHEKADCWQTLRQVKPCARCQCRGPGVVVQAPCDHGPVHTHLLSSSWAKVKLPCVSWRGKEQMSLDDDATPKSTQTKLLKVGESEPEKMKAQQ